jgi:hypothetical protein
MYKLRHLARIAIAGFDDMVPAVRRAFNANRDDDRLDRVFGPYPRIAILGLLAAALLLGGLFGRIDALTTLAEHVHFPAFLLALAYAILFRRYLFLSGEARPDDFPWLTASLLPPVFVLVLLDFLDRCMNGGTDPLPGAPLWTAIATTLDSLASSLSVAAAVAIAVAALCYSRHWGRALAALTRQLIVFKVTVFVMVLLLVEIGIVGPVLTRMLESMFGLDLPRWLGDLADRITHAALMGTLYLFIIGATWTAARRSFGQLLAEGQADILQAVKQLADGVSTAPEPSPDTVSATTPEDSKDNTQ